MNILWEIAERRTPLWDSVFSILTKMGEETVAIVVICLIYWCISKRMAYFIGAGYFIASLGAQGMKITFRIDRPWIIDPDFEPVGGALKHATSYSFPSGHTTSATALFGSLGMSVKQLWLKILFIAAIPTVAFSRMYLGVHTPADVGVAFIFTIIVVAAVYFAIGRKEPSAAAYTIISAVITAIAISLTAYSFLLYSNGTIALDYASDCCKAAGAAIGFAVGLLIENRFVKFSNKTAKFWHQVVKYVVGLGVLLAIKTGLKIIIGDSLVADTSRYFIMIFWAMGIWPAVFSKIFPSLEGDGQEIASEQ